MGTTFCNAHIYNPNKSDFALKKDYCVINIAEGWDTILEAKPDYKFKAMMKIAKDLSAQLKEPAICVNYFDDDVFEMSLYLEGVKKAYYQVSNNTVFKKNIPILVKALQFDDETAKAFRYLITKEIFAPEAIDRAAALCSLPLYLDMQMYDALDGQEVIPDRAAAIKELEFEKKAEKAGMGIKKEPSVIQEVEGVPYCYNDVYNGIITLLQPDSEGEINLGHCRSYQLIQGDQPRLEADHDIDYDLDAISDMDYKVCFAYENNRHWGERFCVYRWTDFVDVIAEGKEACRPYREKILIPEKDKKPLEFDMYMVGDSLRIQTPKGKAMYDEHGVEYMEKAGNYNHIERINDKIFPNHHSLADEHIQYFENHLKLYAEDGFLLRIGEQTIWDEKSPKKFVRVDFFDTDMKLRDTELVPVDFDFYRVIGGYCYIKEKRQIIVGGYCVDLNKKQVTPIETLHLKLKEKISSCIRITGAKGEDYIAVISPKTVYILNMDLKPVYFANIQGMIMGYWFNGKGDMFMITTKYYWDSPYKYKNDSVVRIVKLEI